MRTHKRAEAIAEAAAEFSDLLGPTGAEDLMGWVAAELGHPGALDTFVPQGGAKARALAPGTILHVVSGNTPHAALQSLIGGLLLGSRNLVKLPRGGLAAVEQFLRALPGDLRALLVEHRLLHRPELLRGGRADLSDPAAAEALDGLQITLVATVSRPSGWAYTRCAKCPEAPPPGQRPHSSYYGIG